MALNDLRVVTSAGEAAPEDGSESLLAIGGDTLLPVDTGPATETDDAPDSGALTFESGPVAADAARPADGAEGEPGGVDSPLTYFAPQVYADDDRGIDWTETRPNPREISNAIFAQNGVDMPNSVGFSNLLWVWGQFIDHDLSLTEPHGDTVSAPIYTDPSDPDFLGTPIGFSRVTPLVDPDTGDLYYPNEITSVIDGSNVYGSTAAQRALVDAGGGKIALDGAGLIAFLQDGTAVAGDIRAGENVALTAMHALFAREHNRLVDEIAAQRGWTDPTADQSEALYDAARAQVEAIMQAVTFNDWLPKLVGEGAIAAYSGYESDVDPSIAAEFSTAVFRVGHTLLSSTLARIDETGAEIGAQPLALRDAFFNNAPLEQNGVDPLFRGLAATKAQELDTFVIDDVRNFLFGQPGQGGFDLVSLNIQRGRDLGVAPYNDLREAMGLARAESFADITSDADLAMRLEGVYGDVDSVDAWVGGLAEDAVAGGVVGELFAAVMVDQFTRLRDGDRFWSQNRDFDSTTMDELWSTTLSDVILRNTDVAVMQADAFMAYARQGGGDGRDMLRGEDDRDLLIGFGGSDYLLGGGGDDHLDGGADMDILMGGDGDDALFGGDGRDRLYGGEGDNLLDGGDGDDMLVGGHGDELFRGGDGDDIIRTGGGDDIVEGGAGSDNFMFYAFKAGYGVIRDFSVEDTLTVLGADSNGGVAYEAVEGGVLAASGDVAILLEGADLGWFVDDAAIV